MSITSPRDRGRSSRALDLRPLAVIALALGLVWATQIAASSWKHVRARPKERTIRVTGFAKKRIVSDLIEWEATLEAEAADRTIAYKRLSEQRRKAVDLLRGQGIAPAEIRPQSATVEERFETVEEFKAIASKMEPVRTEKKVSKSFAARQVIRVRSSDVARVERASCEVTSLLEQGVSVTSESPAYFYTRLGERKIQMLAAAGKDARARAENIIGSTGGASVGRLIVANMGIINVNPANSTETSEEGNNDRTSLEKDIITIVHAEFALD